jgi:hypothetical protein
MISMTSVAKLKEETGRIAKVAWVTLGMPLNFQMIKERVDGIIDVEALIIATLLVMERDRIATDLPAWINRFSSLINFQKLKTVFRRLPEKHSELVAANLNQAYFTSTPKAFRNVFGLKANALGTADETISLRTRKINTIENVAQACLMIKNRLIYGTGFRADLITLTHIANIGMKGTALARLMSADNSTVSRVLNDLKASRFLNQEGERAGAFDPYPGMFISVATVSNLCEMMDAMQFSLYDLKKGTLANLNLRHDAFGRKILEKLF